MAIPSDGVVQYEGRQFIFLTKDEKSFEMIEVNAGENDNGYTAISLPENSNLKNEQFVLKGAYSLLMMMKNKEM